MKILKANEKRIVEHSENEGSTLPGPKEGQAFGLSSMIIEAINDEWKTIDMYNSMMITAQEEGYPDFVKVIEDIASEENRHVGQLQEILKTISPNAKVIADGEQEAKEQHGEDNATLIGDDEVDMYWFEQVL